MPFEVGQGAAKHEFSIVCDNRGEKMRKLNVCLSATIAIALVVSLQSVLAKPLANGEHLKDATITHRKANDVVRHSHPSAGVQSDGDVKKKKADTEGGVIQKVIRTDPSKVNRINTGASGGKPKDRQ